MSDRIMKNAVLITPSDTANVFSKILRFRVGVAGNVAFQPLSGANVIYTVPAGGVVELAYPQKVLATGTTANNIIGEY